MCLCFEIDPRLAPISRNIQTWFLSQGSHRFTRVLGTAQCLTCLVYRRCCSRVDSSRWQFSRPTSSPLFRLWCNADLVNILCVLLNLSRWGAGMRSSLRYLEIGYAEARLRYEHTCGIPSYLEAESLFISATAMQDMMWKYLYSVSEIKIYWHILAALYFSVIDQRPLALLSRLLFAFIELFYGQEYGWFNVGLFFSSLVYKCTKRRIDHWYSPILIKSTRLQ